MIIKSSQRCGAKKLADHLTNHCDNEVVLFGNSRGILSDNVHDALKCMDLMAKASNYCRQHFYHVSINPDGPVNQNQWHKIWQLYEKEFALEHNAFIEVTHIKNNRPHVHRVYERVGLDGKAVRLSFNRLRNEKVARIIEHTLGHSLTVGRHNRSVVKHLEAEGNHVVANWLKSKDKKQRPKAAVSHTERQQEVRTKVSVKQVRADLTAAYTYTDNGCDFQTAIAVKGYRLAKGDRRGFVIVDYAGGVHSLCRRLGVKIADIKAKWADVCVNDLPTVAEVRECLNEENAAVLAMNSSITLSPSQDLSPEEWPEVCVWDASVKAQQQSLFSPQF